MLNNNARGWEIIWNTSNGTPRMKIISTDVTDIINVFLSQNLADNVYHHYVWTYDGSKTAAGVKLYLDGDLQTLTTSTDNLVNTILNNEPVVIGATNDGKNHLNGELDDIRIFNSELSASQVAVLAAI